MIGTQVKDWMSDGVLTISPEATLDEAYDLMEDNNIRRIPVSVDGRAIGLISRGDVRAAMTSLDATRQSVNGPPVGPTEVRELMTPEPITISEDSSLALAAQTMLQLKVSGLPVVDAEGLLIGVLSESDLFRYIIATT